jgi:hypothetical protein
MPRVELTVRAVFQLAAISGGAVVQVLLVFHGVTGWFEA